jgi:hypothetical protein
MVLADLGRKINSAFTELTKAPVIDEKVKYYVNMYQVVAETYIFFSSRFSIH